MRLDRLTIGSEQDSPTHQFKNLKNVTIDFDENQWITVIIGWNGTGKSNVLEALAIIFRDLLDAERLPAFAYELHYRIGDAQNEKKIKIVADPDLKAHAYQFEVTDKKISIINSNFSSQQVLGFMIPKYQEQTEKVPFSKFVGEDSPYLPRYVFSYYSGLSSRMENIFRPYIQKYDKKLRGGKNADEIGFKRMFYALPIHSQFVLLAFLFKQDKTITEFLDKQLGINAESGVESILFELRQPSWNSKANDGDARFWNARGVVKGFLAELYDIALAPIKLSRNAHDGSWNKKTREYLYLFLKDMDAFNDLIKNKEPGLLFRDLESTYVSELIEAIHIRVKLKKNEGNVTFKELSEGEQQLLTVLGLLRFTSGEDSLFLLDEPDTHLNPKWSVDYLKYLEDFVSKGRRSGKNTSHIVLTTHNPLAIAELEREQIQILHRRPAEKQIYAKMPEIAPRGMGYAGIVTSDMFGLNSALDTYTQELLEKKRLLTIKDEPLNVEEREQLEKITLELEGYGFRYAMRDPIYEEYLRARYQHDARQSTEYKLSRYANSERHQIAKQLIQQAMKKIKSEQLIQQEVDDAKD